MRKTPPIRWTRYCLPPPHRDKREWTGRRLAHAKKAVERELAAVPLFPELARYKTVEDRVADRDATEAGFRANMRQHRADEWRRARQLLRSLPAITRQGVLFYWSQASCPSDPTYLLGLIRESRTVSPWKKLRELRTIRLISTVQDTEKRQQLVRSLKEAA